MNPVSGLHPVHHYREDRIRAHVQLCWLALLLTRVAENATAQTWRSVRHELDRMHLVTLAIAEGTVAQCSATTPRRAQWESTREELCERAQTGYPEVEDAQRRDLLTTIARENCEHGHLYRGGDAANLSIGQGDVLTTPLQMAQVYAAVASGGPTTTPRLADAFIDATSGEVEELEPTLGVQVPLDPAVSTYLRDSLTSVVTTGTAAEGFAGFPLAQWPVAGKTGSAERGHGNDVSWFISYAPADSPRYVVAVAIIQAGLGSEAAVPVARTIHETLLTLNAE